MDDGVADQFRGGENDQIGVLSRGQVMRYQPSDSGQHCGLAGDGLVDENLGQL